MQMIIKTEIIIANVIAIQPKKYQFDSALIRRIRATMEQNKKCNEQENSNSTL